MTHTPDPSTPPGPIVTLTSFGPPAPCSHCGDRYPTIVWSGALIVHYKNGEQCEGKRLWEPPS